MRQLLFLAILCPLLTLGQSNKITPLTIGDTVPDIPLSNIINYRSSTASLSSFKGKLLILDFWAIWCTSCLHAFPKLDSLRLHFGDSLQLLLVNEASTRDDSAKIRAFFQKHKNPSGDSYNFALVVKDTILCSLFPHKLLPHYVWMYNGKLLATTSASELTVTNIRAVLQNKPSALRAKADILNFNRHKPLFLEGNGGNGAAIRFRSTITGYLGGLPSGSAVDKDSLGRITRICITNASVLSLYKYAWQAYEAPTVRLKVSDPSKLTTDAGWDQWKYNNTFSYELILPPSTKQQVHTRMQHDLEQFFGYQASLSKQAGGKTVFTITENQTGR